MSVKISRALTAEGVAKYHAEEYASNYSRYYDDSGRAMGVWFGKEAAAFGLTPGSPVDEEHFKRLANGQDPHTGIQLIEWRAAADHATSGKEHDKWHHGPAWVRNESAWREYLTEIADYAGRKEHPGDFYARVDAAKAITERYGSTPVAERAKVAGELIERYEIANEAADRNFAQRVELASRLLTGEGTPEQRHAIGVELEELQRQAAEAGYGSREAERAILERRAELGHPGQPGEKAKWMEHRAAWDITISAPKTVSLTALVGGDKRIVRAHDEAAREAMGYVERAIQVKMGGLNARQTTGRMVAALFRHDTARPVNGYMAPQLHTHGVVFNLSQDGAGQYRALNPRELFCLQAAAEAVYQNALAVKLKAMGYELEYGKNLAIEIKGYTQAYRDAESPRTAEIERKKAELGMYGPGANQNIALSTREAKLDLRPEEVRAKHLEHAGIFGNQPHEVVEQARGKERQPDSEHYRRQHADEAVQFAKHTLSERTTVMEWHELHKEALRFGRGYITLGDVEQAFARARERGEFSGVSHWREHAPESRWTTPELMAAERQILSWMAAGRGKVGAIAGTITRDEFREQFKDHLNNDQKWLVWNLIHSQDRMVGVQGIAGSGKTRAMATVRDFAERYGYEVRGIAATTQAVAEMRKVGIWADTLAAHALREEKQTRARLYLLDEASLTDVHQMQGFLQRLKPADRVIVIGDTRQHASLGAGRIFAELQDAGMQTFHLKSIVRQRYPSDREIVRHLSQGQIRQALGKLQEWAGIHEFADERERFRWIAAMYRRDPLNTVVISPDNRSRQAISDVIRAHRAEAGELRGEIYRMRTLESRSLTKEELKLAATYQVGDVIEYQRGNKLGVRKGDQASVVRVDRDKNLLTVMRETDGKVIEYNPRRAGTSAAVYEPRLIELQVGDRVQFTRSLRDQGIANRQMGTLEAIGQAGNVSIKIDDGRGRWTGNLEKMQHLDHGYAFTSHSKQGGSNEVTLLHLDTDAPNTARMLTQQLIYTAGSRHRDSLHIFTNSREELPDAVMRDETKATALAPEVVEQYRGVAISA